MLKQIKGFSQNGRQMGFLFYYIGSGYGSGVSADYTLRANFSSDLYLLQAGNYTLMADFERQEYQINS